MNKYVGLEQYVSWNSCGITRGIIQKGEKIPRNEICPATNKKYKNCCGAL